MRNKLRMLVVAGTAITATAVMTSSASAVTCSDMYSYSASHCSSMDAVNRNICEIKLASTQAACWNIMAMNYSYAIEQAKILSLPWP
ncbi:hypothetical protein Slala04_32520 [Streptomyces lavendulae subsp. lavendulae]|nr:hypothetical protein Slala04_32520 [Streptomyces lavendulae subsp. lavendulae]